MSNQAICMGCFAEWDTQRTTCTFCGWSPGGDRKKQDGWQTGLVLEQRYILGEIYQSKLVYTIWRAYDMLMDMHCFLVRKRPGSDIELIRLARMDAEIAGEEGIQILTLKWVSGEETLIFSMHNPWLGFGRCRLRDIPEREVDVRVGNIEYIGKKYDNALPQDTILAEQYRIIGALGAGGFGITYLCEDINTGNNVAVKEYYPAEWAVRDGVYVIIRDARFAKIFNYGKEMFEAEIQMTAKFIHTSHIVTVLDAFEENDTMYMVMEYLQGKSLGKLIREQKDTCFPVKEWEKMIVPVLEGLQQMHENKIIHSDISPGNIICTDSGKVVVIDLGAAKYIFDEKQRLAAAFLKPDYAAPEQYQTAKSGVGGTEGPWTDIYMIGALSYYCLLGHKAPSVMSRLSSESGVLEFTKKEHKKLKTKWEDIIQSCMELDRTKRPADIGQLLEMIRS